MNKYDSVLFDLDGTLTDSGPGITESAHNALVQMGIDAPEPKDLGFFVGPPLSQTFAQFGMSPQEVEQAITIFRARYTTVGKFENIPYDGIEDLLGRLKQDGYRLFVATSKPEPVAVEIMEHFGLAKYFEAVCGASMDHSRETKDAVIAYLKENHAIGNAVMIGDTHFDVIGAKAHGIPCIGVTWGFGKKTSMVEAGALGIASDMDELYDLIHA
ncbi:MAG: HAD hydrolase-like protein [Bulleidia sp.]